MARSAMFAAALAVVLMAVASEASYLTGTKFPFEGCVQNTQFSPYYATLVSYSENAVKQTSQICLQLHVAPTCTTGMRDGKPTRCCNTHINKLKLFPAFDCRGSVASATIANKTVTSVYWEEHDGFDIVKITPLMEWLSSPAAVDNKVICLNLRAPCWTMAMLSFDKEVLEYALYDKKVNDYECCPVGLFDVTYEPFKGTLTSGSTGGVDIAPAVRPASPKPSPSPKQAPKPSPSPSPQKGGKSKSPKPAPSPKNRSPKPSRG
ncbi:hypothetical protein HYH02_004611 [Chlamydomonas schloesseri]|uniref:Pherophorin domain-containing protein n=1 Tax=Chlamydomonas schloesseri TaxID=2026947 RepID=A0A836B8Z0_9CHLO|nr:hypothetical protein HYH02_004611 [Chlamydomonas schloesseri]|eukprot:KAG2450774.1 hypothetical protein HYH02_004611 [Chlamydomonas schloesseri]